MHQRAVKELDANVVLSQGWQSEADIGLRNTILAPTFSLLSKAIRITQKYKSVMACAGHPAKPGARTRVLLVEGHVMVRQALARLIDHERDLQVCGEFSETSAALEALSALQPDLILTDITLKNGNGLELIKVLAVQLPEERIGGVTFQPSTKYLRIEE